MKSHGNVALADITRMDGADFIIKNANRTVEETAMIGGKE